jgi:hypothetical protein
MLSVVLVAVKVAVPVVDDLTVKVAIPLALVVPKTVVMVSVAPRLEVRVTTLLGTAAETRSLKVTVTVEVFTPLAETLVGDALTVEVLGETV